MNVLWSFRRCCLLFLWILPIIAWAGGSGARVSDKSVVAPTPSWNARLPFATTVGSKAPIRLQGHGASARISFSIPFDQRVKRLSVAIHGSVSQGMTSTAFLEAEAGNEEIAQFKTTPGSKLSAHFDIPVAHMASGFHTLVLRLVGVPGDSGTNWLQINTRESQFWYLTTPQPLNPQLDHLDWLFDRASLDYHPVVSVFAPSHSSWAVDAESYVAEGVGLRYQFLPVRINVHDLTVQSGPQRTDDLTDIFAKLPQKSRIAVLIGTATSLQPILDRLGLIKVDRATIAVQVYPGHPDHAILLITGADARQVVLAARTFADPNLAYPSARHLQIDRVSGNAEVQSPAIPISTVPFHATVYPLAVTGFKTVTINGFSGPINVRVWNGGWQRSVELRLNLVYSAGMAPTSDVNVLFNGALEGSIPLNAPSGGKYIKYAVSIPSSETRTGWNTLSLVPNLIPAATHDFLYNAERANLQLSIYANSTLTWQGGNSLQQFDLTALSSSGFLGAKAGEVVNLVVPDPRDPQMLSALATLLAKVAQRQGGTFLIHAESPQDINNGPILAVGPLSSLPITLQRALALKEAGDGFWRYSRPLQPAEDGELPNSEGYSFAPGKHGYALSARFDGYPLLAFTAPNSATLRSAINRLTSFGMWPQLRGFTDWWRADGKTIHAIGIANAPFYAFGTAGGIGVWASQHIWAFLLALIAVAVGISAAIFRAVRNRFRRIQREGSARPVLSASGD
ncbi:cellulose biosynthesis cyclic di-GMP-binding regulatory protein BcsB [Acidithiobacillus caldus]|uniref:Cyclic di-GMP-binding protein n=1 Tax=Acidithiobacillus caldus (strain ATCC 51756 / DSM 8584 / KU) TaxID=637389 RepID=A0A060A3E7_ACICK|nr:cellulose biosynthesis cyclic di-GMP-binding regulatory protein BcsB [Acidithiobacillus caldus]AIA56632.1 hypothetical protein Acaty_m0059 [Acidithiobacillus caldus ATCC 51756]